MILVWWSSGLSAPVSTIVWYFCSGEVDAVTASECASLVKGADPHTFGSGSNYSRDSAYPWVIIEVQCRKRTHKRAEAVGLPPPVFSGEHRGGDAGGRRVSHI